MSWKTVPYNRKWAWRKFVSRGWARIPGAGSLERFVYSFLRRRMAADWAIVHCLSRRAADADVDVDADDDDGSA